MVEVVNSHRKLRFPMSETRTAVHGVIRGERKRVKGITVVFVNSAFIRRMNQRFLDHDYITDVISFPLDQGAALEAEIYINLDRARSQAKEYRVSYRHEVKRLLIHGTLHLVGYDDDSRKKRERMRKREDYYLARLTKRSRAHA